MCGRSVVPNSRTYEELAAKYGVSAHKIDVAFTDRTVVPGNKIHVLMSWKGETILVPVLWGFQTGGGLYNARSDAVSKSVWRDSFRYNRCVFPTDAFVEGHRTFRDPDGAALCIAGIYGILSSTQQFCAALLTTDASPIVAPAHDRMPVLVPAAGVAPWIALDYNERAAPLLGAFTEYSKQAKLVPV